MKIGKKRKQQTSQLKLNQSSHTKVGWSMGVTAVVILSYIGIRYIILEDQSDRLFGFLTLLEAVFALTGLIFIDLFQTGKFMIKPDKFSKIHPNMIIRVLMITFVLFLIQLLFQAIPLTSRTIDRMLATVFAAPSEELFFRGFILSIFMELGKKDQKEIEFWSWKIRISNIEIIGILLSSLLFALLHINYYSDIRIMASVFCSGLVLGFFYTQWKDLTALTLAHFILNSITVIQLMTVVGV